MNIASTMLLAVALTGPQPLTTNNSDGHLRPKCIISVIHEVNVPAKRNGVLMSLKKHDGDEVEKNTTIANIDDRIIALARDLVGAFLQSIKEHDSTPSNPQTIISIGGE